MEIKNDILTVYAHINKANGKIYIGQTRKKPETRWQNGTGYRTQQYFWRAIQKYGWDGFEHQIIASNLTQEEADNFETLLIAKLDTINPNKGYNRESGGNGQRIISKETKELHRQAMLGPKNHQYGKPMSEEAKLKRYNNKYKDKKNICQIDIASGEIINRFNTYRDAAHFMGVTDGSVISKCCRGVGFNKTYKGYYWKLYDQLEKERSE